MLITGMFGPAVGIVGKDAEVADVAGWISVTIASFAACTSGFVDEEGSEVFAPDEFGLLGCVVGE